MPERLLIVNADDFGLSPGVTRGITEAHRVGVVTSTSALVTLHSWVDTAAVIQKTPKSLGIGLHFDILAGEPMCPGSSLTDVRSGRFLTFSKLVRRAIAGRIAHADVVRECDAQIARLRIALRARGSDVTHLDSHRHTHMLPIIARAVRESARAAHIDIVRRPRESPDFRNGASAFARTCALQLLATRDRASLRTMSPAFLGAAWQGTDYRAKLAVLPRLLRAGITELMVHPGYVDDELRRLDGFTAYRETELRALADPQLRAHWASAGVRLINFAALQGSAAPHAEHFRLQ